MKIFILYFFIFFYIGVKLLNINSIIKIIIMDKFVIKTKANPLKKIDQEVSNLLFVFIYYILLLYYIWSYGGKE